MQNKRGQLESVLLVVITLFVLGVILFFFNHVNDELYSKFDEVFEGNELLNDTEAHQAIQDIGAVEESNIWDYAFLAIYIGLIIQIVLFSFATNINIAFFWLMIVIDIPVLIVGVVLSNIWQELVVNPEFATTITRFPITDTLLGSYFPIAITFIFFLLSIVLFGKRPGQRRRGRRG